MPKRLDLFGDQHLGGKEKKNIDSALKNCFTGRRWELIVPSKRDERLSFSRTNYAGRHIMKPNAIRKPRPNRSGRGADERRKYLEFQLDPATLQKIKLLAGKAGCTPFEMSVILLQEELSRASSVSAV
jgi:hypothetical protein